METQWDTRTAHEMSQLGQKSTRNDLRKLKAKHAILEHRVIELENFVLMHHRGQSTIDLLQY